MDISKPINMGALGQYKEPDANSARTLISQSAEKLGINVEQIGTQNLRAKDFTNAMYAQSIQASISQFSMQMQLHDGSSLSVDILKIETSWAKKTQNTELLSHLQGLTPAKAKELISDGGYFGIEQTAARISDFVLNGAGDDIQKLKAGRSGVIRGLQEASKMLGGLSGGAKSLAQSTIDKALEAIDKKINSLGENILDIRA